MKKLVSIGLLGVIMLTTFGVSLNKHYCHGTLMTTSVYQVNDTCGDMPMPDDCCQDETIVFEIHDEFSLASFSYDSRPILMGTLTLPVVVSELIASNSSRFFLDKESPPYEVPPIYLLDESFLI